MGPEATADFFGRLIAATPASRDQDHLHIIVDCDPSVPDRSEAILEDGPDPAPTLMAIARRLEAAGAELLVMACNTAHHYASEITPALSVPFVDWPGVVADTVISSGARRIGLLATSGTVRSGIYHAAFEARGAIARVPTPESQQAVMDAINTIKCRGSVGAKVEEPLRCAITSLLDMRVDAILVACTELSVLWATTTESLTQDVPAYDAADIVARHVVATALGSP